MNHLEEKKDGVKEDCIFNNLQNFHTTQNVCCDIMHDLLEGICRYDRAKILNHLIYRELNRRIKYFDYNQHVDFGNRIPPIIETHIKKGYVIMSEAEMLSFVVYFSFLVGDLVDKEDECWRFYLTLYDILHFCLQDEIDSTELIYLKYLIKEHHELYINLFNEKLMPKYHFLIHYPKIITNVGPLNTLSSMRYEAFHKIGKTNAHIVTSRINIIYTLAIRYQLKLFHRFQCNTGLRNNVLVGKTIDEDKFDSDYFKTVSNCKLIHLSECDPSIKAYEILMIHYNKLMYI
ncbi:hypothetical protein NQ315_016281 [Exocentrus adspersus]|uniref:Uncharacterized protein n=1 Tax=Exocentrus adspersus TaxID=1586481 RepID=A0AAV8VCF5_9CUCU|nr:hypothetical protein NQ315_016281 [Exocentrus adspersus]